MIEDKKVNGRQEAQHLSFKIGFAIDPIRCPTSSHTNKIRVCSYPSSAIFHYHENLYVCSRHHHEAMSTILEL